MRVEKFDIYTVYTIKELVIEVGQNIALEKWRKYNKKEKKEEIEWRVSKYNINYDNINEDEEPARTCIERKEYKSRNAAENRIRKVFEKVPF